MEREPSTLKHVAAAVSRERRLRDLTQEELAQAVGMSSRNLRNIENATTRVGQGSYALLEAFFGWDLGSAYAGYPTVGGRAVIGDPQGIEVRDILEYLERLDLDADDRKFIIAKLRKAAAPARLDGQGRRI